MNVHKPILCLDFDGVIHSYESGWQGVGCISDDPVPGACDFLLAASVVFDVAIFSSRSAKVEGVAAMQAWLHRHMTNHLIDTETPADESDVHPAERAYEFVHETISWPMEKPPAFITIDDRALTFDGMWPKMADLVRFKPWNRKKAS